MSLNRLAEAQFEQLVRWVQEGLTQEKVTNS